MPSGELHLDKTRVAKPPLIVIVGPTGVGKTEISIQLASRLNGEIVSADSRLVYRGMDIGTAKPTEAERQDVPHHLIDVANPDEVWSLAVFQREAARAIAEIHARGRLPFLVGGTGQYIRCVTEGWNLPPQPPDPRLRETIDAWSRVVGARALHAGLARIDPEAAMNIEPGNVRRTVRAFEVIFHTGERFSAQRLRSASPYEIKMLGLVRPRTYLYERIDRRIESMFEAGLIDEVKVLLAKGYSSDLPTLSAIGYQETIAYLQGRLTLDEAKMLIRRLTRAFVRRQANWFKADDPAITWFDVHDNLVSQMEMAILP
jgi:tRNA dimethylallyltransferase